MIKFQLLVALFLFSLSLSAQELIPKWKKGKYGFSHNREIVIPHQFDAVAYLFDERFYVSKDGLWGIASLDPNEMIPCEYETLQPWRRDEYIVSNKGLFGIIDSSGAILWDMIYDEIDHTEGDTLGLVKYRGQWALNQNGVFNYNEDEFFYVRPDSMPLFRGDESCMPFQILMYIQEQIRYPELITAKGDVMIQFIIDKNGDVRNPKIIRGLSGDIDEECIRVVQNMPQWQPGVEDGKIVETRYSLCFPYGSRFNR